MKKIHFIAIMAAALSITACNGGKTAKDAPEQDSAAVEAVAEDSVATQFVMTNKGIGNDIVLGTALDALPQQVEGLYDKVVITQQEDEGETTTVADFTLAGKAVMTGGSIDGKTLSNISIATDKVVIKSGEKTWNIGSSAEGLNFNKENNCFEQDGVWILADDKNIIYQIFAGEW